MNRQAAINAICREYDELEATARSIREQIALLHENLADIVVEQREFPTLTSLDDQTDDQLEAHLEAIGLDPEEVARG